MRRRIFKYSKLNYFFLSYIVELIILLLVNFILEKSFTYCTNVHSYFEKANKYISLHIVALECKPANSQQGNFTGQRKNKYNLILLLWKEIIFHIFFLQLTIVILSSSFTWTMLHLIFFCTVLICHTQ